MPGGGFAFDAFLLDTRSKQLLRNEQVVALSARQFDVLHTLVRNAGRIVDVDTIMKAGWRDVIVNESSIQKIASELRRALGSGTYIRSHRGRGYCFDATVTVRDVPEPEVDLDALVEPHRAWIEGRAALETLELDGVRAARAAFEPLVVQFPRHAPFHIGLANACVLQFEETRTDAEPDLAALRLALAHTEVACRLMPDSGEAWSTRGFALACARDRIGAIAASQRAVMLEPDRWLIWFRHGAITWGDERYRSACRALDLYPHCPQAHWLLATVEVGRGRLERAEREIDTAQAAMACQGPGPSRFSPVAINWLKGRLRVARGADDEALAAFEEECANRHHLYARECRANSFCDIATIHLRRGRTADALAAIRQTLEHVPRHFTAHTILRTLEKGRPHESRAYLSPVAPVAPVEPVPLESHIAQAADLALDGNSRDAADYLAAALIAAPPGSAGWQIPIDPMLRVWEAPDVWRHVLQILADRAA